MQEIYQNIRNKFFKDTSIDVERGSTIDYYILATSNMISDAHKEIENNKTPHIYSSLKGEQLDDAAVLVGLTRRPDESDKNFLYRILNWNVSNKASNLTAIETALMDMQFCSHVTYVPHTFGCGTSAAYIIPKNMNEEGKELAIEETKARLKDVVSPSSYIEYIIPKISSVKMKILINAKAADVITIKKNIEDKIIKYVNGIAPGEYLEVGEINRLGTNEANVKYFNVGSLFINNKETGAISILQKVDSKFVMSEADIIWLEVE
jgi:hypothetical protein